MAVKIIDSLESLIKMVPEVQSILILDGEGVPIITAGEEIRNRNQYSVSYNSSMDQAKKLGLGEQKFWAFRYEMNQLVLLNIGRFAVYIIANSSANTGMLCTMDAPLAPILKVLESELNGLFQ